MATRHSNRRPQSGRAGAKRRPAPPAPAIPPADKSAADWKRMARTAGNADSKEKAAELADLDEVLGHFSEALALAETAYAALDAAQEDCSQAISPAVLTLERGIRELGRVYTELDEAIMRSRS